jgi:cell division septation protein DedD
LSYVRVITCRIGTVIPCLRGVRLAIVVIVVVWIIAQPRICKRSAEEKPVIVKSIAVEPAIVKSIPMKPAKSTAVEPAPAVETTTAPTVETAAPAMHLSIGVRLAEHSNA